MLTKPNFSPLKLILGSPFKSLAVDEFDKSNRNYSSQKFLTETGDVSYSLRRVTETRSDFKGKKLRLFNSSVA
jgi:hypothetical protein